MSIERARELTARADALRLPTPRQGARLEDIERDEWKLEVRRVGLYTAAQVEAAAAAAAAADALVANRQPRRKWWRR